MRTPTRKCAAERGMALISSLLLLMVITIIALSMFRSFATQEHIAGNVREKERALHAAEAAQQYAEWWLIQGSNASTGVIACGAGSLNGNPPALQGQICNQTPQLAGMPLLRTFPWATQVTYLPPGMSVTSGVNGVNADPPYALTPAFYITDLGPAGDGQGEAYQIDAYGTGSTAINVASTTVAVVESTYELQQGVVNRGGL